MENYERDLRIKFDRKQRKEGISYLDNVDQSWFVDFLLKEIKERDNVINRELAKNYHNTDKDEVHIYRVPKGLEPDTIRIPIAPQFKDIMKHTEKVDGDKIAYSPMKTADIELYPVYFFTAMFRIGYDKKNNILAVQESQSHIKEKGQPD